jgi:hypothetical protein
MLHTPTKLIGFAGGAIPLKNCEEKGPIGCSFDAAILALTSQPLACCVLHSP